MADQRGGPHASTGLEVSARRMRNRARFAEEAGRGRFQIRAVPPLEAVATSWPLREGVVRDQPRKAFLGQVLGFMFVVTHPPQVRIERIPIAPAKLFEGALGLR